MATPDPAASAIITFGGAPISMTDAYIVVRPERLQDIYEVTAHFADFNAAQFPFTGVRRGEAEVFVRDIVAAAGGLVELAEVQGPKGPRLIPPSGSVAEDLVNPFTGVTYPDLYLISATHQDEGQNNFSITYQFSKPRTSVDDGTAASAISFNAVVIGNRGGAATIEIDGTFIRISATSHYVWESGDPLPLDYLATLSETLGLNKSHPVELPRGAAVNRSAVKSYNSTTGIFEWDLHGDIDDCVLQTLSGQVNRPGILDITASFLAKR
jgi:hypothetical protein